jgi:hypothetical protein
MPGGSRNKRRVKLRRSEQFGSDPNSYCRYMSRTGVWARAHVSRLGRTLDEVVSTDIFETRPTYFTIFKP